MAISRACESSAPFFSHVLLKINAVAGCMTHLWGLSACRMDIIPIQLGIMKRSERGGAPVFHGSLKRPVMERMMEIFLVHNNELA